MGLGIGLPTFTLKFHCWKHANILHPPEVALAWDLAWAAVRKRPTQVIMRRWHWWDSWRGLRFCIQTFSTTAREGLIVKEALGRSMGHSVTVCQFSINFSFCAKGAGLTKGSTEVAPFAAVKCLQGIASFCSRNKLDMETPSWIWPGPSSQSLQMIWRASSSVRPCVSAGFGWFWYVSEQMWMVLVRN